MRSSMFIAATPLCAALVGTRPAMAEAASGSLSEIFKRVDDGVVVVHTSERMAAGSPAERLGVRGGSLTAIVEEEELLLGGDRRAQRRRAALGLRFTEVVSIHSSSSRSLFSPCVS
jgi:hypothetical protein